MKTVKKLSLVPYTFLLLNWAVVAGLFCYAQGHPGFWEVARSPRVRTQTPELRHP